MGGLCSKVSSSANVQRRIPLAAMSARVHVVRQFLEFAIGHKMQQGLPILKVVVKGHWSNPEELRHPPHGDSLRAFLLNYFQA